MEKDYSTIPAIMQFDPMACWAACMEWWLQYMSPTRPITTQYDLAKELKDYTYLPEDNDDENFGGLTREGMLVLIGKTRFKMKAKEMAGISLSSYYLNKKLKKGPVLISFYDIEAGGYHANVIVDASSDGRGNQSVAAMEPRNRMFTGRPIIHYQQAHIIMGYAK
jgi:hypothetical protein